MLIGRTEETQRLTELLNQVREGMSGVLVLRGEAGIGKTALLDATVEAAQDLSVIPIEGIESEMQLGYAALHRLLISYLPRVALLPEPQRDALQSAFGLTSSAPADRFMVSLAALSLLSDVAQENPLLIIVDDAQWLDRESVAALVFVARRLYADGIGLVFAARESPEVAETFQGIPELRVNGLSDDFARRLLTTSASGKVSYRVAEKIVTVTRGNPLALIELSGELSSEHLAEVAPLPDPLPISELIEARFLRQVRLLPADTQLILLVAAADPEGDADNLRRAGEGLGLPAAAIEPAVDDRLVVIHPRVEFRHPLIRSAVYHGATTENRRLAHHALAAVMDTEQNRDRWALHMALGAAGPHEDLAAALEQSASQARARGGYIAESSLLVRAADLTPDPHRQAGRLLAAAHAAYLAGNAGYSESLLQQARTHLVDPIDQARALRLEGGLRYPLGEPHLSPALLIEAARALGPLDRVQSHHALLDAFVAFGASGQLTEGITVVDIAHTALESLRAQSTAPTAADLVLKGVAMRHVGPYADAMPPIQDAIRAQSIMSPEEMIRWNRLGIELAADVLDEKSHRQLVNRQEVVARAQGSLSALAPTLVALAADDLQAGQFGAARQRYSELHDLTMTMGGFFDVYNLFDVNLLGWQGDGGTPARATALREIGTAFHSQAIVQQADLSLSVFALGVGDYETALAAALPAVDIDATGYGSWALPFVVEAGTHCGHRDDAANAVDALADRATASGTPWALGTLARCRALVAKDSNADKYYQEALGLMGKTSWLLQVAHIHLLYGEWLRRQKRRSEARDQLRRAHELFDNMGARAFAERARVELLATGERARIRQPETAHDLTPRELQIARLATEHVTNREIAGRLFISTSTVDYHLRKVFQKLGISSRRQLAGVLPDEVSSSG